MTSFVLKDGHVLLDGKKIEKCTAVEIRNINPNDEYMEVILHLSVDEVDVHYAVRVKETE